MTENPHARARQLFDQSLVEGLGREEQAWFDAHLRECAACSAETVRTQELLRAFRNLPVAVPRGLAARAQMRVRLRAQESAETSSSNLLLWIVTAASWLLGVFSAPFVWRLFSWAGAWLDLPKPLLELGFVLWWTVPALIAVVVVIHQRAASNGVRSWNRSL